MIYQEYAIKELFQSGLTRKIYSVQRGRNFAVHVNLIYSKGSHRVPKRMFFYTLCKLPLNFTLQNSFVVSILCCQMASRFRVIQICKINFWVRPPPQWAKLGGQAMQLNMTLHCEDLRRTNPTHSAICQGRPKEIDPVFLYGAGGLQEHFKGI